MLRLGRIPLLHLRSIDEILIKSGLPPVSKTSINDYKNYEVVLTSI